MEMKKFVDIENLRDADVDLGGGIMRKRNDLAFRKGNIISITEKIDGSNASIAYDVEDGTLKAFSRRQPLAFDNTLAGFYNYVQTLPAKEYADTPNYVIFGEWSRRNKIIYDEDKTNKWYIYSIYDKTTEQWLPQAAVIAFANKHNLEYVHELYYGPFISWEHCRSFCHSPAYGERQEGIVIRNMDALANPDNRYPHILKIVNEDFAETQKRQKVVDPAVEAARAEARSLMETIVTRNRIEKELLKMRDDGIIGDEVIPEDMKIVAKNLPKRIYTDCIKEEPEIVEKCGEYAGKMCSSITMQIARDILLG